MNILKLSGTENCEVLQHRLEANSLLAEVAIFPASEEQCLSVQVVNVALRG